MRLGITGTYSSGKDAYIAGLGHLLGIPRTQARTMREILPEAAPGKTLEEVTSAQLIQMIVARHSERAVHEHALADDFISDGCSLQEWIYGSVRVKHGVNPNASVSLSPDEAVQNTPELNYFKDVMLEPGKLFKRHVSSSFDMFIHLSNELSLAKHELLPVSWTPR